MKKARVIYNPSSGREEGVKYLANILDTLEEMGYETSAFATKGKGDAAREAERVTKLKFNLIVAVGGDGTVNEVVNGMAGKPYRPKLAILPLGTTNDFARAIGVPRDINKALEVLKKKQSKAVDIGKMNDNYFINIAGGGSLTELTYEVPSKLKTAIGQLAYYLKGMEKIAFNKSFKVEIETDGKVIEEEIMMFLVTNTNSVGGFEKLAPFASYQDGYLDALFVKKCNIAEFGKLMTLLLRGGHLNDPKIIHFKTNNMVIRTEQDIQINLDGELGGMAPCNFEVLKKHIKVIVNQDFLN